MLGNRGQRMCGIASVIIVLAMTGCDAAEDLKSSGSDAPCVSRMDHINQTPTVGLSPVVQVGSNATFEAIYSNGCAAPRTTWSSSNPAVMDVSSAREAINVQIIGKSPGSSLLTAQSDSGTATLEVAVRAIPLATITVSTNATTLNPGQTATAAAVLKSSAGATLTDSWYNVAWTTSAPGVATVAAPGPDSAPPAATRARQTPFRR